MGVPKYQKWVQASEKWAHFCRRGCIMGAGVGAFRKNGAVLIILTPWLLPGIWTTMSFSYLYPWEYTPLYRIQAFHQTDSEKDSLYVDNYWSLQLYTNCIGRRSPVNSFRTMSLYPFFSYHAWTHLQGNKHRQGLQRRASFVSSSAIQSLYHHPAIQYLIAILPVQVMCISCDQDPSKSFIYWQ